ncbi:MAG: tRNA uridine-5-carboxymethylaminomethyl(34) synthesis enzyme MnmG [Treponema sp.]|nr:tRNA uridine-5-carboxymethylaminomethyl(34) synthesis enzyme MnmG [Treponema sp.]
MSFISPAYDVIVVGAGHGGIEAALATARTGFKTLLITQSIDAIGWLSCNPSIGGISKGNIVREIDALGGEMAKLIDKSMIQFRMLNKSRGPAVQAPRAQADKLLYSTLARKAVEDQQGIDLLQDTAVDLITEPIKTSDGRLKCLGIITERGRTIPSTAVILTTGTFMEGRVFIGEYEEQCGRLGESSALGLGKNLRRLGFAVGRLKTGTPPRILRSSIDFSKLAIQNGEMPLPFSFSTKHIDRPSVPCWLAYTNPETHRIIRENFHRSPLFSGKIEGVGPRYCPSIEDKVNRFPQRDKHQLFIEPEGLSTQEIYLSGFSSSLPEEVQDAFMRTLLGFEKAVVTRPGYAVEYDYVEPTQLFPTLETKHISGLFCAGQINGSSGYEEAAGQGLVAGINASRYCKAQLQKGSAEIAPYEPFVLARSEAYIGVLIDDLVTLGTKEPYRMFTARAEYRLALRHDTCNERLCEKGFKAGLRTQKDLDEANARIAEKTEIISRLRKDPKIAKLIFSSRKNEDLCNNDDFDDTEQNATIKENQLFADIENPGYPQDLWQAALIDYKYEHYIEKQNRRIEKMRRMDETKVPHNFDYEKVAGLSAESRQKLEKIRPQTLGQAGRISGIRQSDIMLLMVYLR